MNSVERQLAELESLYDVGRYDESVSLGESMLALPGSPACRGRIRFHLAMSYLQLGKPELGSRFLPEARANFDAIHDAEMIVECMAADATVAYLEQRPDALDLTKAALGACRALPEAPNVLELRILNILASTQLLVGQRNAAIDTFEEAIELADPVVDMRRLAKLLGDAGIAYAEIGQVDMAIRYSSRAVALMETLQDLVPLARELNNLGWFHIRRGDLRTARRHLDRSLELFEQTNLPRGRVHLLLSLCELHLAERNFEQAKAFADAALDLGESENEAWSVADAHIWKGRVAAKLDDHVAVDRGFQRALDRLENAGMPDRLIECHTEYAGILERRGDLRGACEHLRLALHIRSLTR